VYLILFTTRVLIAALSFIAGVSKLLSGFAKSRKALADFDIPKWVVAPISVALPCMELVTACLLLPPRLDLPTVARYRQFQGLLHHEPSRDAI
jgi:ABC-type transport system involved in cytochrome c biogenesis permease subunit